MKRTTLLLILTALSLLCAYAADEPTGNAATLGGTPTTYADGSSSTLARFYCRRSSGGNRYLTSTESGEAHAATLTSKTALSQIWMLTPSGDGYTFLCSETGEYLTATFSNTGSATTLYLGASPNNGMNDNYYCISSSSDFSGYTCLNLSNTNYTDLFEWTCGDNDYGSDWVMETVSEVTVDEVIEHLDEISPYASELTSGQYYRIISYPYDKHIAEANNELKGAEKDETNFAQCWMLTKSGSNWQIRNALTDNYIQSQTTFYASYTTATTPQALPIASTDDELAHTWYIHNTTGDLVLHCASSQSYAVVPWYTSEEASKWLFQEIDIDEDALAAARGELGDYDDLVANLSKIQASLDNLFSDKACTTLKGDIASLTDDQLATNSDYASLPAAIQEMVMKVKNDTWSLTTDNSTATDSYEKFCRIADYRPYSNYQDMAWETGQSNCFGKLSGPTGIYINTGDILYIYVDENAGNDCTLQAEIVPTEGTPGDHPTGTTTDLTAGLNVLRAEEQCMVYIFYQIEDISKSLANYPDIKIHIEGGNINGYWDATRGMTNQDWANMKDLGVLGKCGVLNMKTENLVFAMDTELVQEAIATAHGKAGDAQEDVELLMRVWDKIPENEQSYQGLEEYEGRMRNVWNAFSVNYNYMYASSYGTYYENSTLATVMDYYAMTHDAGSLWGPSHEMGHNHQGSINLIGTTESSNNLFSNINVYEAGISTTRGPSTLTNFNDLAAGSSWLDRNIWVTTRIFFQLYLYFHVMENDTLFLPNLFKALREDPIVKNGSNSKGKDDYLHFAEKVCEVANADLSEFFEAYGMFVPESSRYVDDYGTYYVTTSQSDIDSSKKKMQSYEKKLGNIMFIDDHIEYKKADPDNKFEAVPSGEYKVDYSDEYPVGLVDVGDYEDYDGRTEYCVDGDYYTLSGSTITFNGTGYMGHKVYDLSGNLIWACANKTTTLPDAIKSMFPDNVVVVAAEANMNDVPCPYYRTNSNPAYSMQVSFPDGVSNQWWASDNIDAYLPTNAIAVLDSSDTPETIVNSINVVYTDNTSKTVVIDGDIACRIPQAFTALSLSFTKSDNGGYQALDLPFAVTDATTMQNEEMVENVDVVQAGEPVVVYGDVAYSYSDIAVVKGNYIEKESGYILSSNGSEVVLAEGISPFTYVFGEAFDTGVSDPLDFSGKRISAIGQPVSELPADDTVADQWYLFKMTRGGTTPAYDSGEGEEILRASVDTVVHVGTWAADARQYLLRFIPTGKTSSQTGHTDIKVYNLQWGTGRYWSDASSQSSGSGITSSSTSVGEYNVYYVSYNEDDNEHYFAMNAYDLAGQVNNNGRESNVVIYSSGYASSGSMDENAKCYLCPITLQEITEEQEAEDEALLDVIKEAYEAYEANSAYNLSVEEGTSDTDPVGNGLIRNVSQLYSPNTDHNEGDASYLAALIDGDHTTYWHSEWHDGDVDNDYQYLQVELPDDYTGGELLVRMVRRYNALSDQITKMGVKYVITDDNGDETECWLATIDLDYDYNTHDNAADAQVCYAAFTCPEDVRTLRFHCEETQNTTNGASGRGFWHMAEFQLFGTSITSDCGNATIKVNKIEPLREAIATAEAKEIGANAVDDDLTALRAAIDTYLREEITWRLGAEWGTLILPFNEETTAVPDGLIIYPASQVSDSELTLGNSVSVIAPKTPYVAGGAEDEYTFEGLASFKESLYPDDAGILVGTLVKASVPEGDYVLQNQSGTTAFYLVNSSDITCGAYHCYLTLGGNNVHPYITFPGAGEETAISETVADTQDSGATYDLSGRKVSNPLRGVYIKGGRKFVVK